MIPAHNFWEKVKLVYFLGWLREISNQAVWSNRAESLTQQGMAALTSNGQNCHGDFKMSVSRKTETQNRTETHWKISGSQHKCVAHCNTMLQTITTLCGDFV